MADDMVGIVATATDYIESWLDGDGERMGRCLHRALAKRAVEDPASGDLDEAPYDVLVAAAARRERTPTDRAYEVTVLDVFDGIATVKVLSVWFMDYLHLARFGERWLIVNVLYATR